MLGLEKVPERSGNLFSKLRRNSVCCDNNLRLKMTQARFSNSLLLPPEMNPLDYVYRSVGCQVQVMDPDSNESQYLLQCLCNAGEFAGVNSAQHWTAVDDEWLSCACRWVALPRRFFKTERKISGDLSISLDKTLCWNKGCHLRFYTLLFMAKGLFGIRT